jgi:hypothetical protein
VWKVFELPIPFLCARVMTWLVTADQGFKATGSSSTTVFIQAWTECTGTGSCLPDQLIRFIQ